jgi:Flp pilus assembly protein TadG
MKGGGRRRGQSGSALVESAFAFLVLFLLVFGIIEYARLMYAYNFVAYAAQRAVRWASVRSSTATTPATTTNIESYVDSLTVGLADTSVTSTTTWTPNNQVGSTVQVEVAYTHTKLLYLVLRSNVPVKGKAQMVIVQ